MRYEPMWHEVVYQGHTVAKVRSQGLASLLPTYIGEEPEETLDLMVREWYEIWRPGILEPNLLCVTRTRSLAELLVEILQPQYSQPLEIR